MAWIDAAESGRDFKESQGNKGASIRIRDSLLCSQERQVLVFRPKMRKPPFPEGSLPQDDNGDISPAILC